MAHSLAVKGTLCGWTTLFGTGDLINSGLFRGQQTFSSAASMPRIAFLSLVFAGSLAVSQGGSRQDRKAAAAVEHVPLRLARLFADGMVLQRDQPVVVWGWAD